MSLSERFSLSKERALDIGFLLAVSLAFVGFTLYQINLPGLYGDEVDKLVPTVSLLTGQPIPGGWHLNVFGCRILLAFTERIGPVLSYLPVPFILLFDYTPFALRLTCIFCAWLTLIFAYFGAKVWCGPAVARFGIALAAVNPAFVFSQRMGYSTYGPVTLFTSLSFFFLARYISKRANWSLWMSAVCAGVAIETALQALFVLVPMTLLSVLFFKDIKPRPRDILVALCISFTLSLPVILLGVKTGAILERIGWGATSSGSFTVRGFLDNLSVEAMHLTGMFGGLDGIQIGSVGKHVRSIWMEYAFWLSLPALLSGFVFSPKKLDFIRRDAIPMLISICGFLFTGFLLTGPVTYQMIVLWPFVMLAIGSGLAQIYRSSRWLRPAALIVAWLLVISQIGALMETHRLLAKTGGRGFTSSQIYSVVKYLDERPELRPVAMDWGLLPPIYYLTRGRLLPDAIHGWWPKHGSPPDEFFDALRRKLQDPNSVFLFYGPEAGLFDRYPEVERFVRDQGRKLNLSMTFYERDGVVAYRLVTVD